MRGAKMTKYPGNKNVSNSVSLLVLSRKNLAPFGEMIHDNQEVFVNSGSLRKGTHIIHCPKEKKVRWCLWIAVGLYDY